MPRNILIIDGHPDPRPERLGRSLIAAYVAGAEAAGHRTRIIKVAELELPLVRSADEFNSPILSPAVVCAQADIRWAEHLAIFYPLWLGAAPAMLKGFFEQVFRYGFALSATNPFAHPLRGRSARLVVTMGMPATIYEIVFGAFGVRGLERSVLRLSGIRPARHTLLGGVGNLSQSAYRRWIAKMHALGAAAA